MGIVHALLVVIGFSFLIAIHELGHFLAAKRAGIQCPVFSVGFPIPDFISKRLRLPDRWKNIFSYHWRGTDYRIGWIPLGGFVQMKGQSDSPEGPEENAGTEDDFRNVSYFNKFLVICGGVFMNAVTGIVFFILAFMVFGVTFVEPQVGSVQATDPKTGEVTSIWKEDTIQVGDRILTAGGEEVEDYLDVIYKGAFADGDSIPVTLERIVDGEKKVIEADLSLIGHSLLDFHIPAITQPLIVTVSDEEAAWAKGELKGKDRLLSINGIVIQEPGDVRDVLATVKKGEKITLTAMRGDDEEISTSYVPARKPSGAKGSIMGFHLVDPVMVKAVQDDSPASKAMAIGGEGEAFALQTNDVVLAVRVIRSDSGPSESIEWIDVKNPHTLFAAVSDAGAAGELQMRIARADKDGKRISPDPVVTMTPRHVGPTAQNFSLGVLIETGVPVFEHMNALAKASGQDAPYDEALIKGEELEIAAVMAGSAAEKAGLKPGQRIVDVSDVAKTSKSGMLWWSKETSIPLQSRLNSAVNAAIADSVHRAAPDAETEGDAASVSLKIKGSEDALKLVPQLDGPESLPTMIVGARELRTPPVTKGFVGSIEGGIHHSMIKGAQILQMLGGLFAGDISVSNLSGPVMIVQMSYTLSEYGLGTLLFFLGFISINLAIINLLPLPVLDGGLLVIVTIEKLTGRPINERFLNILQIAGTVALVGLLVYVVFNDIKMLSLIG